MRLLTHRYMLYFLPYTARSVTFQHCVYKACGTVAILKGREHRGLCIGWCSFADPFIRISDQIEKCIRPGFLVSARQMNVTERIRRHQRRVFHHYAIWLIMSANPKLILLLLLPLQGEGPSVQLELQIILVAG